MLTEEQAKTKTCPILLAAAPQRAGAPTPNGACIGSQCMVWRWIPNGTGGPSKLGFCGLGGRQSA